MKKALVGKDFGEQYRAAALATWESGAKCVERMLLCTDTDKAA